MSETLDYRLGRIADLRLPAGSNFAMDFTFSGITLTGYEATLTARRGSGGGKVPFTWSKSGLTVGASTISFDYGPASTDDNSKAFSTVAVSKNTTEYALTIRQAGAGAIVMRLQGSVEWVDSMGDFEEGTTASSEVAVTVDDGTAVTVTVTNAGHSRSHAMTSTSDHTAGNWKLFYSNGSGAVVELALGSAGKVLTAGGTSAAPTFETPASGVAGLLQSRIQTFTPSDHQDLTDSFADIDGSSYSFTPSATGTVTEVDFYFTIYGPSNGSNPLPNIRLMADGVEVDGMRYQTWAYNVSFRNEMALYRGAYVSTGTSPVTLKLQGRRYNSSYPCRLHRIGEWHDSTTPVRKTILSLREHSAA